MKRTPWWNRRQSPEKIEQWQLRICLMAMLAGATALFGGMVTAQFEIATIGAVVFGAGVAFFD